MLLAVGADDPRQQVEDGGAVGGNFQLARVHARQRVAKGRGQGVDAVHQRPRQLVQRLARRRGKQAAAVALQQRGAHFALQGLELLADRGLADVQGLGRARHRTQARDLAEGPQRFQAVALVGEAGGANGVQGRVSPSYKQNLSIALSYLFCQIVAWRGWWLPDPSPRPTCPQPPISPSPMPGSRPARRMRATCSTNAPWLSSPACTSASKRAVAPCSRPAASARP